MKKILTFFIIWVFIFINVRFGFGYDNVKAHPKFNQYIVEEFNRRLPIYVMRYNEFRRFGKYNFNNLDKTILKGVDVIVPGSRSITEGPGQMTAKQWIIRGGYTADQPEIIAALRHFYDPIANNDGKHYLTDLGTEVVNPAIDAIYWAFTGIDQIDRTNEWTWDKGKEYIKSGLETSDPDKAGEFFGKAFRCLGEVLHNTADMGCPPHVRNDAHGGYPGIGGTDPYESLFNSDWIEDYAKSNPDPDYAREFRTLGSGKKINIALAEFTNKNFFSDETISGTGVKEYNSRNGMPDYPAPKLQGFDYNTLDYGYRKKFESERVILMCIDKGKMLGNIVTLRSDPKIEETSVESQATELIPNIIEAGINILRLFIPHFNIVLSQQKEKTIVNITHVINEEYPTQIRYSGKITFMVKSTDGKITFYTENLEGGRFEGDLPYLKNGDKVQVSFEFADIKVNSDELIIEKGEVALEWLNKIYFAGVVLYWSCPDQSSDDVESNISMGTLPFHTFCEGLEVKCDGKSFSAECTYHPEPTINFGVKYVHKGFHKVSGNIEIVDATEGKMLFNFRGISDETVENHSGYNFAEFSSKRTIIELEIKNLPFWHADYNDKTIAFLFEKDKTNNQNVDFSNYIGKATSKKIITVSSGGIETVSEPCSINSDLQLILQGHFKWK